MESSLVKSFTNASFDTNLTVIMIGDQIWFIAKEVAEALDYSSVQKALQGVKDKYKKIFTYDELQAICQSNQIGYFEIPTRGLTLINKSGLIQLVLNSTKPEAEAFQDWVLEEVIPQVLDKGSYSVAQLSAEQQLLLKAFEATRDPIAFAAVIKERDEYVHKSELKRSMTSMGRLGGVTTALNAARDALNTANETIKSITSEYDALRESIGQSEDWQSSAQLITNYPEIFGNFKSTSALTRYLKKRNVPHKRSDHPDKTGYLFTIFNVEEATNVAQ